MNALFTHCAVLQRDAQQTRWQGSVHHTDSAIAVCGLEISFSSVPQDVDIKLIPNLN